MAIKGEGEDEDEVFGSNSQCKDSDVDTLIAMCGMIKPKFVKNSKKTR